MVEASERTGICSLAVNLILAGLKAALAFFSGSLALAALVCINKADIYPKGATQIETYCRARDIKVVGCIPFDATVTVALVQGQPVTAFSPNAPASQALAVVWQQIAARISESAA